MSFRSLSVALLIVASFACAQPHAPIPQQLTFTPYQPSGIYDLGATVGWTVKPGPVTPTYPYKWTIRRNNAVVLKEGKLDLSSGQDKIEIVGDQPEMLYVAIEPVSPAPIDPVPVVPPRVASSKTRTAPKPEPVFVGGNTGRNNGLYALGAAVAPTTIPLSTPVPADFDEFWRIKLDMQAQLAIDPVLTSAQSDVSGVDLQTFVLNALGSHAQGYVARPQKEGQYPALIVLQWAGVYALNPHAVAARAAQGWLVLDVDAHDKLPSDPEGGIPKDYTQIGNANRETSYFLNMYMRDSRVLDYLLTRPDWDGKTIVLLGTSQGGQQSFMLAGLRPEKISAVLVCVPAGADVNADLHGRKAGFPSWPSDKPDVMKTALYFDPVNFARHIRAPVLAAFGFIDTVSPPAGIWTVLNQIPAPVEPLSMIESEHNNYTPEKEQAWNERSEQVLELLRTGQPFKPNTMK